MLLFLYQPDILEYIFQWDIGIYIYIYWDIDEKCFYISQYPIDGGFHKWGYPKQLVWDGNVQSKMSIICHDIKSHLKKRKQYNSKMKLSCLPKTISS